MGVDIHIAYGYFEKDSENFNVFTDEKYAPYMSNGYRFRYLFNLLQDMRYESIHLFPHNQYNKEYKWREVAVRGYTETYESWFGNGTDNDDYYGYGYVSYAQLKNYVKKAKGSVTLSYEIIEILESKGAIFPKGIFDNQNEDGIVILDQIDEAIIEAIENIIKELDVCIADFNLEDRFDDVGVIFCFDC